MNLTKRNGIEVIPISINEYGFFEGGGKGGCLHCLVPQYCDDADSDD